MCNEEERIWRIQSDVAIIPDYVLITATWVLSQYVLGTLGIN